MIAGLIVALSWGYEVARAVQMVNKSTVKTPGLLAAAVCNYSRSYNLKRRLAADSL